jgi:plastocyanin
MTRPDQQGDTGSTARRIRRRRICLAITGVASTAVLAACGSSSPAQSPPASSAASVPAGSGTSSAASGPSTAAASQPAAQPAVITIDKFAYTIAMSVSPGAMVTVVNKDEEAHTVTADSGNAFDDKATAGASTQFRAPTQPGSYPFHCTYHSNMHGVLVVK